MAKKQKTVLTEEQRQLRNEQKLLKEEELRKKKLEQAKKEVEAKLREEERISKLNRLALHEKWRQIMREAKAEDLRKDVDILAQTQERIVDRKDSIIQRLETTLREIEEQHQMAISSHLNNVQVLLELYNSRAQALEDEFQLELAEMESEFAAERFR